MEITLAKPPAFNERPAVLLQTNKEKFRYPTAEMSGLASRTGKRLER
jgi:hypothetical protein